MYIPFAPCKHLSGLIALVRSVGSSIGLGRGVVLKKKWVGAIRSGWTPDVCKVTNAHKTYIMDHFLQRSE